MKDDEAADDQEYWWRRYLLGIAALASFVLSNLAFDYFRHFKVGGWIIVVEYMVVGTLALFWLIVYVPPAWRRFHRWRGERGSTALPGPTPRTLLRSYAAQAERSLITLGSEAGGMAAAAWFEQEKSELLTLLYTTEVDTSTVDDLAWLCDALEAWYVRQRQAEPLLALSHQLTAIAKQAQRPELEELAAIRAATAYRLLGDLESAADQLRAAIHLHVPAGAAEPAIRTRLAVEQGLLHLAWAERYPHGDNRDEEMHNAQKWFDEAGLKVPRADPAADIAIQLDRGLVCLHRHDTDGAKEHFQVAEARAAAARDVSAQAHALELLGMESWQRRNTRQAVLWWQEAQDRYAAVEEREGQARCLQHLGSAELVTGDGYLANILLEKSATLRGGADGHEVLERYLAQARRYRQPQAEPAEQSPTPPSPNTPLDRLRQRWRRWWYLP